MKSRDAQNFSIQYGDLIFHAYTNGQADIFNKTSMIYHGAVDDVFKQFKKFISDAYNNVNKNDDDLKNNSNNNQNNSSDNLDLNNLDLNSLVAKLWNAITGNILNNDKILDDLITMIKNPITGASQVLLSTIAEIINDVTGLGEKLKPTFDNVSSLIQNIWNSFSSGAGDFIGTLINGLVNTIKDTYSDLQNAWNKFSTYLGNGASSLFGKIEDAYNGFSRWYNEQLVPKINAISTSFDDVKASITKTVQDLLDPLKPYIEPLAKILEWVTSNIWNLPKLLFDFMTALFFKVIMEIFNALLPNGIEGAVSRVNAIYLQGLKAQGGK